MKKYIALIVVVLLTLTACSNSTNEPVDNSITAQEIAQNFITDFTNKEFSKMISDYSLSEKMNSALNVTVLEQVYGQLIADSGEFKEIVEVKTEENNGIQIITILCKFENENLNFVVPLDSSNTILSFTYNKHVVEAPDGDFIYFGDEEYQLRGKLTIPEGEGPFPALIIVHGSGAADMDLKVGESTPYKDIAESLKDQGIAVLRYDKRTYTYGDKMVQDKTMTVYDEYIDDSHYALEFLMNQEKIDKNNIFIAAHSQSGYLIPRIAENNPEAKGFIVMAGMVTRTEDLLVEQTEYLNNLDGNVTPEEQQILEQFKAGRDLIKDIDSLPEEAYVLGAPKSYWLDLKDYEPLEQVTNIKKPTLFLQGERDYQVTMNQYNQWIDATVGLNNFSFKSYPKLNHLFIAGEGQPGPHEYGNGGEVSPDVIADIAQFIVKN